MERKGDDEPSTVRHHRLDPTPSAVLLDHFADDRQPDPAPSLRARCGAARERRPDLLALTDGYTRTFVGDTQHDFAVALRKRDADGLLVRPVLHRIVEEVEQEMTECLRPEVQRRPVFDARDDSNTS